MSFTYNIEDFTIVENKHNIFEIEYTDGVESYTEKHMVRNQIELDLIIDGLQDKCDFFDEIKEENGTLYNEDGGFNSTKNNEMI